MVHSGFWRFGNLSFINQFSNKWHRLASTASDRKGAQIQHIFMIQTKKIFSKHQSEPEFKNLDDSLDLSSDLSNLRTSAVSINSSASMTSVASIHQNIYWSWWLDHPLHLIDQYQSLFVEWIIKIPIFLLISDTFLLEAIEASKCYFFKKLITETQISKPPEPAMDHN